MTQTTPLLPSPAKPSPAIQGQSHAKGWSAQAYSLVLILRERGEVQVCPRERFPHVEHLLGRVLEVRGGVVGRGDVDLVGRAVVQGDLDLSHLHELLEHGPQQLQPGLDLLLWVRRLYNRAHNGHVLALGCDAVVKGDHHDVDVVPALHLLLGDDDLARVGRRAVLVLDVWNGCAKDANAADNLPPHGRLLRSRVGWVADDRLAPGNLLARLHAADLASLVVHEAVHWLVEHVGAAVDGGEPREALRQAPEAVDGVDEGGASVLHHGVQVQLALLHGGPARLVEVVVRGLQGHGVADEVDGAVLQAVLFKDLLHGVPSRINASMGIGLVVLPAHDEVGKVDEARLLEHPHERRLQPLLRRGGHLVDELLAAEEAGALVLVDVGPLARLPVQVPRDLRLEEDLHEAARGHDELGDEVHVPVAVRAQLGRRLGARAELLPEVCDVQRGAVAAVVVVPIEVKHLLAVHRQEATQNALLEARAAHDDVILLVHGCPRRVWSLL
mmetsp:Transcript_163308/g.396914  ORF Transcript_163308/g.396914 Transcript_163308/m.396914 type:complete len:499 (+) Transcript_163308:14-1510(+)